MAATDWTFYGLFWVFIIWGYIGAFWSFTNTRAHFRHEALKTRFVPVICPGHRTLFLLFLASVGGAFLTLTIPEPKLLWMDPYEHAWVLVHHMNAVQYILFAVVCFNMFLGQKYTKDHEGNNNVEENNNAFRVLFAIMLLLLQMLMEGPNNMQVDEEWGGWDHKSELESYTRFLGRFLYIPLALILILEIFCESKIVVFMRLVFVLSTAAWFLFLAICYGDTWCDNLDDKDADYCDPKPQSVAKYIATYSLALIVSFVTFLLSLVWFRCVPQCVVNLFLKEYQDPNAIRSRLSSGRPSRPGVSLDPVSDTMEVHDYHSADNDPNFQDETLHFKNDKRQNPNMFDEGEGLGSDQRQNKFDHLHHPDNSSILT